MRLLDERVMQWYPLRFLWRGVPRHNVSTKLSQTWTHFPPQYMRWLRHVIKPPLSRNPCCCVLTKASEVKPCTQCKRLKDPKAGSHRSSNNWEVQARDSSRSLLSNNSNTARQSHLFWLSWLWPFPISILENFSMNLILFRTMTITLEARLTWWHQLYLQTLPDTATPSLWNAARKL